MRSIKKATSLLLVLTMLLSLMPAALAAEPTEDVENSAPISEMVEAVTPAAPADETADQAPVDEPANEVPADETPVDEVIDAETPAVETTDEDENAGIMVSSLLDIPSEWLSVELNDYMPWEFFNFPVAEIVRQAGIDTTDSIVLWTTSGEDDYKILDEDVTVDLTDVHYLNLIVGSADQFDKEHIKKYKVDNRFESPNRDIVRVDLCKNSEETRTKIENMQIDQHFGTYYDDNEIPILELEVLFSESGTDPIYMGLSLLEQYASNSTTVHFYDDFYESLDEIDPAKEITELFSADVSTTGGWELEYTPDIRSWHRSGTMVFDQDGKQTLCHFFFDIANCIWTTEVYLYAGDSLYRDREWRWDRFFVDGVRTVSFSVPYNKVPKSYRLCMHYDDDVEVGAEHIKYAVLGHYADVAAIEDAIESGKTQDIKSTLFVDGEQEAGYTIDSDCNKLQLTIVNVDGLIERLTIRIFLSYPVSGTYITDGEPYSLDPFFQVNGARAVMDPDTDPTDLMKNLGIVYVMPYQHDAYYHLGFQTILLSDPDVDLSTLMPTFYADDVQNVYVYKNGTSEKQVSGQSMQDFSNGPVQYSVSGSDERSLKNYWVTFVKKHAGGAKLFVNGANDPVGQLEDGKLRREVFLDNFYDDRHDIFIANVGDEELSGISVTLENAQNVKLDDYWTVIDGSVAKLAPFTKVWSSTSRSGDELDNIAKIRLLPDGVGAIGGTLTISADGQQPVVMELTGTAGDPQLITDAIPEAVKYVPYAALIQTTNRYSWNKVSFQIIDGALPDGLSLTENGEIYGVPKEAGTFTFTVRMRNSHYTFDTYEHTYTLTVADNTDANVDNATDEGYEILDRVPDLTSPQDVVFRSEGDLTAEFQDFWLDGEKMVRDTDYIAEDGSTKITIRAQTIASKGTGTHTISNEFRNSKGELKRAAQNYTYRRPGGSGGSSGGGGPSKPAAPTKPTQPKPQPQPSATPSALYKDVMTSAWYYEPVEWATKNGLMNGTGHQMFAPRLPISEAMVVTVLARLAKADLTAYADKHYPDIQPGTWYTGAAIWAKETGILPADGVFSAQPPCPRGDLALMLLRFLDQMGIEYAVSDQTIAIADADQMTDDQRTAFQTLAARGIFKGKGNGIMDPQGATTRAELATLLQRLSAQMKQSD